MEIMHFSHPRHPLILNKEVHKNESGRKVVCYGCEIPITDCDDDDSTAYECAICNLFLHKRCAEAPAKITHPMHSQHPLTLLPHRSCICNVCCQSWKWFTYNCSQCEFNIDIICALKEDRRFEHKSHEHPLTVQLRSALFHCDACGTKSEDYSCLCTTCPFWIHKTCASLPSIINHSKHNHPLKLAYSLPDMYRTFPFDCDICRKRVLPIYWLYYCGNCRYFVHLKCASTSNAAPEPLLQRDDEDELKAGEDQNLDLVMRFPIPADKSAHLMSKFVKKISSGNADCEGGGEITIDHWNHDHPLILWDGQSKNELNTNIVYDGTFCAACMQPITAPFYHCSDCNYFLHRYCAVRPVDPMEIRHFSHPDHPLILNKEVHKNESCNEVVCYGCQIPITDCDDDDSAAYECAICNLFLHKMCRSAR